MNSNHHMARITLILFVLTAGAFFCLSSPHARAKNPRGDFRNEYSLPYYYFNGNEYLGIMRAPKLKKEISILCFMKPEKEAFKNSASLICRWKDINGYQSYNLCLTPDFGIKIWLEICAEYSRINSEVGLTFSNRGRADEWQHVAVTYDGKDIKAYYNGVLDSDKIFSGQIISPKSPDLILGGKENIVDFSKTNLYRGALKDVHIYNRVLTGEEIRKWYDEGLQQLEKE